MACALASRSPRGLPPGCTWERLFELSCDNSVSGLVWEAAKSAEDMPLGLRAAWERSATMTMLRRLQMDAEREYICSRLSVKGISLLPLKGAVLAPLYPSPTMRSMADNDILYGLLEECPSGGFRIRDDTEERRLRTRAIAADAVRACMEDLGYAEVEQSPGACDMHFAKPPFLSFEMHHALIEDDSPLYPYYANPWARAIAGDGASPQDGGLYRFSNEDLYVYLIAHSYKHAHNNGTGVRIFADIAVLMHAAGERFDRAYAVRECERLGIADYERALHDLTALIMRDDDLSDEQQALVDRMVASGTYGNGEEAVRIQMEDELAERGGSGARMGFMGKFFSVDRYCPPELEIFRRCAILRPLFPLGRLAVFARNLVRNPRDQIRKIGTIIRGK